MTPSDPSRPPTSAVPYALSAAVLLFGGVSAWLALQGPGAPAAGVTREQAPVVAKSLPNAPALVPQPAPSPAPIDEVAEPVVRDTTPWVRNGPGPQAIEKAAEAGLVPLEPTNSPLPPPPQEEKRVEAPLAVKAAPAKAPAQKPAARPVARAVTAAPVKPATPRPVPPSPPPVLAPVLPPGANLPTLAEGAVLPPQMPTGAAPARSTAKPIAVPAPAPKTPAPAAALSEPETRVVLARPEKVWVQVSPQRTLTFAVGDPVPGLGTYKGLDASGRPQFTP